MNGTEAKRVSRSPKKTRRCRPAESSSGWTTTGVTKRIQSDSRLAGRADPELASGLVSDYAATAVSCLRPAATARFGFEIACPHLLMVVVVMMPPVPVMMMPPVRAAPPPHVMFAEVRPRIAPTIVPVCP